MTSKPLPLLYATIFCLSFYQNKLQGRTFTPFALQQTLFTSEPSPGKVSSNEATEFCREVLLESSEFPSVGEAKQSLVGVGDGALSDCEVLTLPAITGKVKARRQLTGLH